MLKAYGEDRYATGSGVLDITEFSRAFCKLRERRGIQAGLYRPSRTRDKSAGWGDGLGATISNPLLPGQSATQTRAGVGKLGTRAPPYNGYSMPAAASASRAQPSGAFTSMMEAAYMEDILVGDHFEKYGRRPAGQRDG